MYAAIDIGSNTVLLLVASYKNGKLEVIHEEQRIPRLAKGVDASKNLHPDSIENVLKALSDYRQVLSGAYSTAATPVVTATSAVRDARNSDYFVREVYTRTGLRVEILSGKEEAKLTFQGALSMLPEIESAIAIDIGGGSTEVVLGLKNQIEDSFSFDMGSVRFTERYLKSDPPSNIHIDCCRKAIGAHLHEHKFEVNNHLQIKENGVIGVAGTITSLAYMDTNLQEYEPEKLNGYSMDVNTIRGWVKRIASMTTSELKHRYPTVMEGRADVFLAGVIILETFMEYYGLPKVVVSTGGIRHGAIIREAVAGN